MNDARIGFSTEGNFKRKLTDKIYNGLRCYEIIDGEITSISLVGSPSNGVMGKIISDEDRLISGPILIPDKMIFRINPITGEEYYIYFTNKVIKKLHENYQNKNWTQNEYETLFYSYIDGKNIEEISQILNKPQSVVENKLNENDRLSLDVIRMSKTKKTINEIAIELDVDVEKLIKMIENMGGTISKRNSK